MEKIKSAKDRFLTWLAGKLQKYQEPENPEFFLPETTEDLMWVLKKTPESVLSEKDRERIAMTMSLDDHRVGEIMQPKSDITFVFETDFLGPLMLDRLYQSGLSHFPVMGSNGNVVGVLHTEQLNRLEIKETDRATKYVDETVYYMREDYSLTQALAAFLRVNFPFFLVVDKAGKVTGLLSFTSLMEHILGFEPTDDFDEDKSLMSVMKR